MDPLGFLESLFQLLWAGPLCAQPALHLVSRKPRFGWGAGVSAPPFLPARPTPGRTLSLPTHAVPFNPTDPNGMWVGLTSPKWGAEGRPALGRGLLGVLTTLGPLCSSL